MARYKYVYKGNRNKICISSPLIVSFVNRISKIENRFLQNKLSRAFFLTALKGGKPSREELRETVSKGAKLSKASLLKIEESYKTVILPLFETRKYTARAKQVASLFRSSKYVSLSRITLKRYSEMNYSQAMVLLMYHLGADHEGLSTFKASALGKRLKRSRVTIARNVSKSKKEGYIRDCPFFPKVCGLVITMKHGKRRQVVRSVELGEGKEVIPHLPIRYRPNNKKEEKALQGRMWLRRNGTYVDRASDFPRYVDFQALQGGAVPAHRYVKLVKNKNVTRIYNNSLPLPSRYVRGGAYPPPPLANPPSFPFTLSRSGTVRRGESGDYKGGVPPFTPYKPESNMYHAGSILRGVNIPQMKGDNITPSYLLREAEQLKVSRKRLSGRRTPQGGATAEPFPMAQPSPIAGGGEYKPRNVPDTSQLLAGLSEEERQAVIVAQAKLERHRKIAE